MKREKKIGKNKTRAKKNGERGMYSNVEQDLPEYSRGKGRTGDQERQ